MEILEIDNAACATAQIARLKQVAREPRRSRLPARARRRWPQWRGRGKAICSKLPIEATRARATVGEISDALEKVFTAGIAPRSARCRASMAARIDEDEGLRASRPRSSASPPRRDAGRASWSPSWARTATTAAPR